MSALEFRLLNDFQRGFPLVPQPFRVLAGQLGVQEPEVLATLASLVASGKVTRIGATFAPGRIGAATLAAMVVPEKRLQEIALLISAFAEVNHNYEREHLYNLWFVVTGPDSARVETVVRDIERAAGCGQVLSLPMVEPYHVDLGFDLGGRDAAAPRPAGRSRAGGRATLTAGERALAAVLEHGLPLVAEPYAEVARRAGTSEQDVIDALSRWLEDGLVNRLGVIVRHRLLGFRANAMVVWDVPDGEVAEVGRRMAQSPEVTLCYRRERRPPDWRYNLYCMIHGLSRTHVLAQIAGMGACCDLVKYPYEVLFSRRCFKQRGAHYLGSGGARREAEAGVAHG